MMNYLYKHIILIGSLLLISGCANMHADVKSGKEARQAGDYETALNHLEPLVEFGDEEAKYELAVALIRRPESTSEDYQRARNLLKEVRGKRHKNALFELGRLYHKGKTVRKNYKKAKEYYTASSELGYQRANYELGNVLVDEKRFSEAEEVCKDAFYAQYYKAAMCLARLHEKGFGGSQNREKALAWYLVAERHDVSRASKKVSELSARLNSKSISRANALSIGLEENEED